MTPEPTTHALASTNARPPTRDGHDPFAALSRPLVFVDLETTGSDPLTDRITEIGVLEVGADGIQEWSAMVDPERPIPPFIQQLTGISDDMVRGQPVFAALAPGLLSRLEGKLFVAHNAGFDFGFLKQSFRRVGLTFRADTLCTVRLSRALYPALRKHGLDALIERFQLTPKGRHRALADADLLWQFWQRIHQQLAPDVIDKAIKALTRRATFPSGLDADALDAVPSLPGVYLLHGKSPARQPLFIGRAADLRQRVGQHFCGAPRAKGKPASAMAPASGTGLVTSAQPASAEESPDARLARDVARIEHRLCAGDIGAQLLEAQLIRRHAPPYNRVPRRRAGLCSWHFPDTMPVPRLTTLRERDFGHTDDLYGMFDSRARAENRLRKIADEYALCMVTLGLESSKPGSPCTGYHMHRCRGTCIGEESSREHALRVREALSPLSIARWPHDGAIAFAERHHSGFTQWHVVDNWCYLGSTDEPRALRRIVEGAPPPIFDHETYAILRRALKQPNLDILPLPIAAPLTLEPPGAVASRRDSGEHPNRADPAQRDQRAPLVDRPPKRVPPSRDPVNRARARRAVPDTQMAIGFETE
ncbi:3'-5' exonuclease family protein [Robbsia andropogonis]|uniref:3'-5' exonuclease family protein n=2 Tax=Robbsia andropogonis TaxID=28092 RepID=UPI00209FAC3F|nr:3'-5' exonuclease family protein [Robbsia andropogonis]MCP1116841.1 exonuclease domain-containing protein [Robbsia andropogonis]MCP1126480.1 exonuclease domain-containing protein [Robbsia andropogonis]